jgi:hypothetical protein
MSRGRESKLLLLQTTKSTKATKKSRKTPLVGWALAHAVQSLRTTEVTEHTENEPAPECHCDQRSKACPDPIGGGNLNRPEPHELCETGVSPQRTQKKWNRR